MIPRCSPSTPSAPRPGSARRRPDKAARRESAARHAILRIRSPGLHRRHAPLLPAVAHVGGLVSLWTGCRGGSRARATSRSSEPRHRRSPGRAGDATLRHARPGSWWSRTSSRPTRRPSGSSRLTATPGSAARRASNSYSLARRRQLRAGEGHPAARGVDDQVTRAARRRGSGRPVESTRRRCARIRACSSASRIGLVR